jgi:ribosome biogenesis protein SSF1/2
LKRGRVGKTLTRLVKEMRTTMYPYTAVNLKESKANSIKDYLSIKDVYGLSHMMMLTNTEKASYMRLAKMPRGPTVTFKIEKYCLSSDIFEHLSALNEVRRRSFKPLTRSFNHVPLVIMNGFNNPNIPDDQKEPVNIASMLIQSFFPPINLNEIQLKKCKRVVLFNLKLETPEGIENFDEGKKILNIKYNTY